MREPLGDQWITGPIGQCRLCSLVSKPLLENAINRKETCETSPLFYISQSALCFQREQGSPKTTFRAFNWLNQGFMGWEIRTSVVIFAIVNRASTGRLLMVSSDPVNSIAWFNTSSLLKRPQSATMTSFPVQPCGRTPVSFFIEVRSKLRKADFNVILDVLLHSLLAALATTTCQSPK